MRHRTRRMKRKYSRLMAAVAGAAVMSSAMLPGIPVAKAQAAENPVTNDNTVVASTVNATSAQAGDPVQVVRDNAATFGFNAETDRFSLLSTTGTKAIVKVRSNGQTFKVDLDQKNGYWVINTIRGIGDMKHAATFIPASFYKTITTAPTTPINQQIIYQTNDYNGWQWRESTYPANMSFGVLLQNPYLTGTAAFVRDDLLNSINAVDFSRQFALYAYLGSVAPQGYGIGIANVTQNGNNLTVTVRTKSPLPNEALSGSKTGDFITLDRGTLDFGSPITITFVDQNGVSLGNYTIINQ